MRSASTMILAVFVLAVCLCPMSAQAASYSLVSSGAAVNWNTAPWGSGEPTYANQLVGLLQGGGSMEINTAEGAGGLLVGWNSSYTVNMTGGSLQLGSANYDQYLMVGTDGGSGVQGVFNHSGGTLTTPGVFFNRYGSCDNGIYTLGNGVGSTALAQTGFVAKSHGSATFNFDGGTLQATRSDGNFFQPGITAVVKSGGAIIDSQGFDVTVNSALLDGGGGGGLTKLGSGVLRIGAAGYTGATTLDQGYLVLNQSITSANVVNFGTAGAYRRLDLVPGNTQTFGGLVSPSNAATDIYSDPGTPASLVLNVANGSSYTYGGTIGAQGNTLSLTKDGLGQQTLAGNVTYTGATTVNAGTLVLSGTASNAGGMVVNGGTLQIGNGEALTSIPAGGYSIASGAKLVFSKNFDNAKFTTQSIGGAGDVEFIGQQNGYFTFRQGEYSGSLTYTGRTIVNLNDAPGNAWYQGALWLEKDDLLPHATVLDLQSGMVFLRNSQNLGQTVAGLDGSAGTFITTDRTAPADIPQKLVIDVPAGQTHVFGGVIGANAGSGNNNLALTKTGPGTQIMSWNSTHNGGTLVSGGTLQIGNNATHGWVPGVITLANGATLAYYRRDNTQLSPGTGLVDIVGTGNVSFQGAVTSYYTLQETWHYTGTTTVNLAEGGWATLFVESSGSLPTTSDVNLLAGNINLRNNQSWKGLAGNGGTFVTWDGGGTGTLAMNVDDGQSFDYAGTIRNTAGTLALVKGGEGTQVLSGANSYTGGTTINAGTLQVDGSITGAVAVNGGWLTGNGAVGPVTIAPAGSVSAGQSPGALTVASYNQQGTMLAELGGLSQGQAVSGYDWIHSLGAATLAPGSLVQVDLVDGFVPPEGSFFDILTADGGITNADLAGIVFDFDYGPGSRISWTAGLVDLDGQTGGPEALRLQAVPEPATIVLLGLSAVALGRRLRRRRLG